MLNLRSNNHYHSIADRDSDSQEDSANTVEPLFSLQEERDSGTAAGAESSSPPTEPEASPAGGIHPPADHDEAEASSPGLKVPGDAAEPAELLLRPLGFGEELRNLRADAGMNLHDVAHAAQASQELIYNLEQEEWQKISVADFYCIACIERLCAVYKVAPDSLVQKFEEASCAAGRQSSGGRPLYGSGSSGSDTVFTLDELSGDSIGSRGSRIPALVIAVLVLMLLGLLAGGWLVQRNRTVQREKILQQMEQAIPKLMVPEPVPLETLPIPNG